MERPYKGKSLLEFPKDYIVIDLETTGLDPSVDEIIEIGAIKYQNQRKIDVFSTLIQPSHPISDSVSSLTGITNDMLVSSPSIAEVLTELREFLDGYALVGHNIHFDINFLYDSYTNYLHVPLPNDFVDTLRIARIVLPNLEHHRLSDLAEYYQIDCVGAHRACTDCTITNQIYCELSNSKIDFSKFNSRPNRYKRRNYSGLSVKDICPTTNNFDKSNPFYNKYVVFTGPLSKLSRSEAAQIIVNFGAICQDYVTKKTNYLILGNESYTGGRLSGKHKLAITYISKGQDLKILSENVFYDLLMDIAEDLDCECV